MPARKTFANLDPEKQRRVMDAAIGEFAEHGFHQASVNRIVAKLGIAKGSLFKYFGSKQGMFQCVFEQAVELFSEPLRRIRKETQGEPFFTRLKISLLGGLAFIREYPDIYRIYCKMLFQEDFPLRERFLSDVRLYSAKYLRPMVEQGIGQGELRPDLDVDLAVFFLDAVLDRYLQAHAVSFMDAGLGVYGADSKSVPEQVDELLTFLRHGLG